MKNRFYIVVLFLLLSSACTKHPLFSTSKEVTTFQINLNDRVDDLFKVTVFNRKLTAANSYFQFAATAPGTYQTMDMGRFVRSFNAFDDENNPVETRQISTNRWRLLQPEKIARIEYEIAETWDTPVDSNRIYNMCGTSLENDHALINGQAVFGYFEGTQAEEIHVDLKYPAEWLVGTALAQNEAGRYVAQSYDHLVDSPIQLGRMTKASTQISDTKIEVYTYSKTDVVNSAEILAAMEEMLIAAEKFIGDLPVDHYTFLYHFEDASYGAWEHSYSSGYVYQEKEFEKLKESLIKTSAHEFFHIITPLNIHSEIIDNFNFSEPTVSKHLWLYEGTTEWAAQIMLLRGQSRSLDDYFNVLRRKIAIDKLYYRQDYSLTDLAKHSFSSTGARQYGNIYMRGAMVAGLLDILLLDLSDGKKGWQDVLQELTHEYGPSRPFSEETFFQDIADKTYPQVADFFESYVENANPLPLTEYYQKIGITYNEQKEFEDLEKGIGGKDGRFYIAKLPADLPELDLQAGDVFMKINGKEIKRTSMRRLEKKLEKETNGQTYKVEFERNGEVVEVESANPEFKKLVENFVFNYRDLTRNSSFVFELNPAATPRQLKLRQKWLQN
ncbi:MAG: PDZ domain-containing protein [Calditrichaeota bacterium]|nr:MAG: PDZ domain-containing protein [Calditrichota bacterium]